MIQRSNSKSGYTCKTVLSLKIVYTAKIQTFNDTLDEDSAVFLKDSCLGSEFQMTQDACAHDS